MTNKEAPRYLDQRVEEITREIIKLEDKFYSNRQKAIKGNGTINCLITRKLAEKRKLIREKKREGYIFCHQCELFYKESNLNYKNIGNYEEYHCPCEHLIKAKLLI